MQTHVHHHHGPSPDLAHVLAELAAIQRDVRTIQEVATSNGHSMASALTYSALRRLAALMASITAPPPAESARVDDGSNPRAASYRLPSGNTLTVGVTDDVSLDDARAFLHVIEHGGPIALPPGKWSAKVDRVMPPATTSRKLEPADNGMLAAVNARIAEVERRMSTAESRIDVIVDARRQEADLAEKEPLLADLAATRAALAEAIALLDNVNPDFGGSEWEQLSYMVAALKAKVQP